MDFYSNQLNALSINKRSESTNLKTRIYPYGKDGLNIESINNGKKYIENFQYTSKVQELVWEDNRYTIAENLLNDAILKLDELSKPFYSYSISIKDLASIDPDEYNFLKYNLGDIITIIDTESNFKDEQRIVSMDIYKHSPEKNTVTLANKFKSFADKQQEQEKAKDILDSVTNENGTIDGSKVENLKNNLEIHEITADIINAVEINVGELVTNKANIDDLHATNAEIINLKANKADVTELTAISGKINILEAESAKIGLLEGDVANVKDVIAGNISSGNIQSGGITGDRLNMNTIFVNDANIVNVNADKINSGEINTSKVKIKSVDGGIEIVGPTQQWKDKNNKVRMQAGKDAQGNFTFGIFDETGIGTLIDHTGVKEKAIANDLIKENMISGDAIGEKQINYNSFTNGFNKDTNTSTLKATKVKLDNQNQTLEIGFTQLKNQADGTKTQTESNTTQINVSNGKIETAIANTKIVKDGKEVLLKDDYNTTVATVDSMKNTISSHTTKIDANTGKIGTVESKTNVLERDLNSMSSKISATETIVNTHTTEISIANTNASNAQSTANIAVTKADKAQTDATKNKNDIVVVNTEVTTTKNKVSGIEQDLDSVTTRVGSVESTTTSHTATINNHTSSLDAVDGKINIAKTNAINTAKSDATTKANDAKTQAISSAATDAQNKANKALNDAKGYTNTEVTKVNSTTTSKFAEIKTTTDSITQSVSNTNKEIEIVKVNVNSKIDNIKIANTNRALDTKINKEINFNKLTESNYCPSLYSAIRDSLQDLEFSISFEYEIVSIEKANNAKIYMQNIHNGKNWANFGNLKTEVGKHVFNATLKTTWTEANGCTLGKNINLALRCDYVKAHIKIEKMIFSVGNKIGGWSQAPEDTSKEILDITTEKVNQAKADIKITTDTISSKVNQVESTTNSINGKVTSHESRIATAEQKITPSSIINTVSKTIDDKVNVVDRKLAEMKLENDNFQVKIEGTHYRNEFQSSNWSILTGGGSFYREALPHGYSSYKGDSKAWRWIYQAQSASVRFNGAITENGIYSVSFYVKSLNGYGLSIICDINDRSSSDPARYIAPNTWTLVKFENITVDNYSDIFNFLDIGVSYGDNLVRDLLISNIMINKGVKCAEWTENATDMYSGVMQMNKNGIETFFEDGTVASMGRSGFKWFIGGNGHTYHCLSYGGKYVMPSEGTATITLPSEFRNKNFKVLVSASQIGNGNDAISNPKPLISFWCGVSAYYPATPSFTLYGSTRLRNNDGSVAYRDKSIEITYIAIA